jgi:molybdenum cofactor cytidylyltransferase
MSGPVAAVVLAAGGGRRFAGDEHKLLVPFRGRPLVVWAVEAAAGSGAMATVVVGGAVDLAPALEQAGLAGRVSLVVNPAWAEGQATSLAAGIAAVRAAGCHSAVVGLGDQPLIPAEAWRRVGAGGLDHPIAVATYAGRRRNPVRLDEQVWLDLPSDGDQGARGLLARRPELVAEVPCPGEPADVDTLEDLSRWS